MTDDEFTEYWTWLVNKKSSKPLDLSNAERLFYAANILRGTVPRSGLIGYFENTECDVIHDAHSALALLGLTEALHLLQDARTIILNNAPLPETTQCIELFDYELPEEVLERARTDLDERVQDIQNQFCLQDKSIYDALCRFAQEKGLAAPNH